MLEKGEEKKRGGEEGEVRKLAGWEALEEKREKGERRRERKGEREGI